MSSKRFFLTGSLLWPLNNTYSNDSTKLSMLTFYAFIVGDDLKEILRKILEREEQQPTPPPVLNSPAASGQEDKNWSKLF